MPDEPRPNNIILIGMLGAGKSTAGVLLATRLSMGFLDTDLVIQATEKRRLQDIIDTDGVDTFARSRSARSWASGRSAR